MKKYIAIILAALMIFTLTPSLAMAEESDTTDGSQLIRQALAELNDAGNPDASVRVAEGLKSDDEVDDFIEGLSDDVLCHVQIGFEITGECEPAYSIDVTANELWNPSEDNEESSELTTLSDEKSLDEYLKENWDNLENEIDISAYNIKESEFAEIYLNEIFQNPEYFNVITECSHSFKNNIVKKIYPKYVTTDETTYNKMKTNFDAAVKAAVAAVNTSGATTTLGKVYVLHNWLCNRAVYNRDKAAVNSDYTNRTAYGTLVNRKGVCQSYTLAFAALLNKFDIEVASLMVLEMNHSWNEVKIDGSWYHVDVTYDDTDNKTIPIIYDYYLKSDTAYKADGVHKGWKNGAAAGAKSCFGWNKSLACTSTKFDNYGWTDFKVTGGHSLNSGVVTKKATATTNGTITYTCKVCKKVIKTKTIKKATILTAAAKAKTVKKAKVKKKTQTVTPITAKSVAGAKITYKVTKYGNSKAKKYLKINTKTGKVSVKKGTPKGTYKITVRVKAAATKKYVAASKTVTVTIKVK